MAEVKLQRKHRVDKMEGGWVRLAASHTTVAATDHVEAMGYLIRTLEVRNGATESVIFTVEGGFRAPDGSGIRWYTLATRKDGAATFAVTANTQLAGVNAIYEIAPTPVTDYIRANVSDPNATNGTEFVLHCEI